MRILSLFAISAALLFGETPCEKPRQQIERLNKGGAIPKEKIQAALGSLAGLQPNTPEPGFTRSTYGNGGCTVEIDTADGQVYSITLVSRGELEIRIALSKLPTQSARAPAPTPIQAEPAEPASVYPSTRCAENLSCYGDISAETARPKIVRVEGYYRKDGTYVRGYYRSAPRRR